MHANSHPLIFLFTGEAGGQHGYGDGWTDDSATLDAGFSGMRSTGAGRSHVWPGGQTALWRKLGLAEATEIPSSIAITRPSATVLACRMSSEQPMKTLVVDNYDSFTFNLVHLLAEANQEEPQVIRNDELDWASLVKWEFDNIVISPGPGRPDRPADFGVSADVIMKARVPILGVCLGHQGIAALHGGAIEGAPFPMHGRASLVHHSGDDLFANIPSPFKVVRYHSLHVIRPLPELLVETAWTEDGLVMALRRRDRPVWGVQFHPESILTEFGRTLIVNFRDLTHRHAASRRDYKPVPRSEKKKRPTEYPRGELRAYWQELPVAVDAESAFCSLYGSSPVAFWLDSSLVAPGAGRWSYLGDAAGPHAATVSYDTMGRRLMISDAAGQRVEHDSVFAYLERNCAGPPLSPPPCPFVGGHIGWFNYELHGECGSAIVRQGPTPSAFFVRTDRFVAIDHLAQRTYIVAVADARGAAAAARWCDAIALKLSGLPSPIGPRLGNRRAPLRFALDRDRATYLTDIERCLDWIRQGETYQVCLTNELVCSVKIDPLDLYRILRRINPAPHAAFLRWPSGAVLSASPERFLSVDRAGRVEAKPIKGTIARAFDGALDKALAERLRTSEKDRAENLMIVDLLRNDLSRVCAYGTVEVPSLFAIESFATVHQLVSTVRGTLRPDASAIDLVRAAFPGGSMTGAPKLRTLQFIDRLEHRARGIYSGALGWIGDDGAADLSIVIRTIVAMGSRLSVGVGGGIVAQSAPEDEFEEMMLKARASIRAIVTAATGGFDTGAFRVEGEDGVIERALQRKHA
jgi:para-aminobenzoate synthetase